MTETAKKHILIRFGDNDFHTVLCAFANVLTMGSHRDHAPDFLTKERVVELFNMLAPGLYWAVQNRGHYTSPRINDYLKIDVSRVHFDDEATKYIDDHQWQWNGDWIFIPLDGTDSILI